MKDARYYDMDNALITLIIDCGGFPVSATGLSPYFLLAFTAAGVAKTSSLISESFRGVRIATCRLAGQKLRKSLAISNIAGHHARAYSIHGTRAEKSSDWLSKVMGKLDIANGFPELADHLLGSLGNPFCIAKRCPRSEGRFFLSEAKAVLP